MNQNDKNKLEKFGMTYNQISELKSFLVERIVDNMSTKDLVEYVTDDLDKYYEDMSDAEFIDEAKKTGENLVESIGAVYLWKATNGNPIKWIKFG